MTDKEFRKLKRPELLEIIFYLQKENEELQAQNDALQKRIDELNRSAIEAKTVLSEESLQAIAQIVRTALSDPAGMPEGVSVHESERSGKSENQS